MKPGTFVIETIQDGRTCLVECGYKESDVLKKLIQLQQAKIEWQRIFFQTDDQGSRIEHRLKRTASGRLVLMQVFDM